MKFDKHTFWMIIGCILPLLLIFIAPAFGINNSVSIFIFIVTMFAIHLFMPMHGPNGHQHGQNHKNSNHKISKKENHEYN